jgi:hypothetical protein
MLTVSGFTACCAISRYQESCVPRRFFQRSARHQYGHLQVLEPRVSTFGRLQMARSKGVEELADYTAQRTMRDYARSAAEQRLAAECTFQPDTRKPRIPDAHYAPAKAAFAVHEHEPQELVQRCAHLLTKSPLTAMTSVEHFAG